MAGSTFCQKCSPYPARQDAVFASGATTHKPVGRGLAPAASATDERIATLFAGMVLCRAGRPEVAPYKVASSHIVCGNVPLPSQGKDNCILAFINGRNVDRG